MTGPPFVTVRMNLQAYPNARLSGALRSLYPCFPKHMPPRGNSIVGGAEAQSTAVMAHRAQHTLRCSGAAVVLTSVVQYAAMLVETEGDVRTRDTGGTSGMVSRTTDRHASTVLGERPQRRWQDVA